MKTSTFLNIFFKNEVYEYMLEMWAFRILTIFVSFPIAGGMIRKKIKVAILDFVIVGKSWIVCHALIPNCNVRILDFWGF